VHVSVPIAAEWTFTQVRRAVIALGRELNRQLPELVTVDWWKEERGERVFIDFNQAARDRTMAAAYSVRATPQATVSAPVTWDELGAAEPLDFTVRSMPERFASVPDPRAGFSAAAGRLDALLGMADADERDRGLGDMPYPPEYPKMPGEPKRVQPSRARPES
jgi:DNA primase